MLAHARVFANMLNDETLDLLVKLKKWTKDPLDHDASRARKTNQVRNHVVLVCNIHTSSPLCAWWRRECKEVEKVRFSLCLRSTEYT